MEAQMEAAMHYWPLIGLIVLVVTFKLWLRLFGVIIIPQNTMGLVNKRFVILGSNRTLPDGAIIALKGEAGYQSDTLAPGLHIGLWPWQYEIDTVKFTTIQEGCLGVVESRDGIPLSGGRVLAKHVDCDSFQNARQFLENGGQRGPQISIIPPGTYRINTQLFSIVEEEAIEVPDDKVGVITTKDGTPLATGEIAGQETPAHNMFQDGQTFIDEGGFKGLQVQVIMAGRYNINPRFASVEFFDLTYVPIAHVGVVISYVGEAGEDVSGDSFQHGNLVHKNHKGVWDEPLDPGMYPINPRTHKVELVPTANVVLNWATGKNEAHNLDKNLSTISVRSKDGFKFNLDVSQIIHVPRAKAPLVIARVGSMANLVTQMLEPTIGNDFRNAAQNADVIDFIRERTTRQEEAKIRIAATLREYNVVAVDTLIGDMAPPEELMRTLTDRKIAQEQQATFATQMTTEDARTKLQKAKALADTQADVVSAERRVQIADYDAQSAVKKAEGVAKAKKIDAEADAEVTQVNGAAEAGKILLIGESEAKVSQQKVAAMGNDNYTAIAVANALAQSGQKLVPEIVAGGEGSSGSIVNLLLAQSLRARAAVDGGEKG